MSQYGDTVSVYIGSRPVLITTDEDLLKAVQIKDFQNFVDRMMVVKGGLHAHPLSTQHIITTNR